MQKLGITRGRTNTYEESSLGIYANRQESNADVDETKSTSYLGLHLKKQLAFDLWYIVLGLFIVLIAEKERIADPNEDAFQVFSILFEIVSAYGNVGLSRGYPGVNTSLAGEFGTVSKLVVCAMMIRGRHRELPYEIDRA
ncbi:Potassium, partial [Aspergillus sclerotialis]